MIFVFLGERDPCIFEGREKVLVGKEPVEILEKGGHLEGSPKNQKEVRSQAWEWGSLY